MWAGVFVGRTAHLCRWAGLAGYCPPARAADSPVHHNRYGAELHLAGRWYASSKTCSGCGQKKAHLDLSEHTYLCEHCGLAIDRDLNAAINLARWPGQQGCQEPGKALASAA